VEGYDDVSIRGERTNGAVVLTQGSGPESQSSDGQTPWNKLPNGFVAKCHSGIKTKRIHWNLTPETPRTQRLGGYGEKQVGSGGFLGNGDYPHSERSKVF